MNKNALIKAIAEERERCFDLLDLSNDNLRLMAGEMTAQELRTTQAILSCLRLRIRRANIAITEEWDE